ncbi:MAG: D-alanine--D-alanine ligase [Deltaproteobacteria bacterium]|nr:D-alanine--D-alanine ligase [Deltaproteobacteria bacterium]
MLKTKKIGVLMGGLSGERDISLQSGRAVLAALEKRGYTAVGIEVGRDLDQALRAEKIDVVFNALHGRFGEDGCVQGLLEMLGIAYTGSGVLASALAMNKIKAKELFRLHNLPTPPYYVVTQSELPTLAENHGAFGFPVVVKPAGEGSSIGVSVAEDLSELATACELALQHDDAVLIERMIPGKEVCVAILNGRALGAIGVVSHHDIFDYEAKYVPGNAHYHVPARLSPERYRGVLTQALRAHQALGCTGVTRVDMIVSDLGNEYILEVNTIPGLTPQSLLPRIARHAGLGFEELVEEILKGARLNAIASGPRQERRSVRVVFPGPERRSMLAGGI